MQPRTPVEKRLEALADDIRDGKANYTKSLAVLLYEAETRIRDLKRQRAWLFVHLKRALRGQGKVLPVHIVGQLSAFRRMKRAARRNGIPVPGNEN